MGAIFPEPSSTRVLIVPHMSLLRVLDAKRHRDPSGLKLPRLHMRAQRHPLLDALDAHAGGMWII